MTLILTLTNKTNMKTTLIIKNEITLIIKIISILILTLINKTNME